MYPQKALIRQTLIVIVASLVFGFVSGYLGAKLHNHYNPQANTTNQALEIREKIISESEHIASLAESVGASVVSIRTQIQADITIQGDLGRIGSGTGIIISSNGYIVTNRHVIGDGFPNLEVELADGTIHRDVTIVGRDPRPSMDVAFIKINDVSSLTPAQIGDSDSVQVGDHVIAIGNVLGQYQNSVTTGIISGRSRPVVVEGSSTTERLTNLLQTDAAINPGNSGGPLVTINGQIIGINTAIADANNVGFAIPINDIKGLIAEIIETGRYIVPYIGVRYEPIDKQYAQDVNLPLEQGAHIVGSLGSSGILADSPADAAGLQEGDIIVAVDEIEIDRYNHLKSLIGRYRVGDSVNIRVYRNDTMFTLSVVLDQFRN